MNDHYSEHNQSSPIDDGLPISPRRAAILVFFSIVAVLLFGVLLRAAAEAIWGEIRFNSPFFLVELLIVIPTYLVVKRTGYPVKEAFRLRPVARDLLLLSFLIGVSLAIIGDQMDRIVQHWFPMPEEFAVAIEALFRDATTADFIGMLLISTLGAGFCEEILFRGFLQGVLEKRTRLWIAIFIPAALFGLIHFMPWLLLQIMVLGLVLGVLAWRTNSVYPSVVVHATNNLVAVGFLRWGNENFEKFYLSGDFVNPTIVLIAIAVFIFSWKFFWRKTSVLS